MIKHINFFGEDGHPLFASELGTGQPLVILHGGGPDRQSIIPFARLLQHTCRVIFPDIRGYGESVCLDRTKHTWAQYARDVVSLVDHCGLDQVVVSGMGLGSSIAERVAYSYPDRVRGVILISPETLDQEGEGSSPKEIELMDRAAVVARTKGLAAAWEPFMDDLAPVINAMVREAFPRTHPESFSAAMAIVHSKRLDSVQQLAGIVAPTLVIPGSDARHSPQISKQYQAVIPHCTVGSPLNWDDIRTADELAANVVPQMLRFLQALENG
jgi:3-oxoadipate enol-lactonase